MDRVEAYRLLTEQMESLAQLAKAEGPGALGSRTEAEVTGASGHNYHIVMQLEQISEQRCAIHGKVYDNNTYRLAFMDERLEFDVARGLAG